MGLPEDESQGCAFAGASAAHQRQCFATLYFEADAPQHGRSCRVAKAHVVKMQCAVAKLELLGIRAILQEAD